MGVSNYSHYEWESAETSLGLTKVNASGALILIGFEINKKTEGIMYSVCRCQMQNKNVSWFQCHQWSFATGWEHHEAFLLLSCASPAAEVGLVNCFSHLDLNFLESEGCKHLSTFILIGGRIWIGNVPHSMVDLQEPVGLTSPKISSVHSSSCWNRLQSGVCPREESRSPPRNWRHALA